MFNRLTKQHVTIITLTTLLVSAFNSRRCKQQANRVVADVKPTARPAGNERIKTNERPALWIMAVSLVVLSGCGSGDRLPSAPLGDRATLETLAEAYKNASKSIPMNPVKMPPESRREFVERVFTEAGYDYSRTLLDLAGTQQKDISTHHRDLKQLLFLPRYGIKPEEAKAIYSEEEWRAMQKIEKLFQ
jgi:hypothetical protein